MKPERWRRGITLQECVSAGNFNPLYVLVLDIWNLALHMYVYGNRDHSEITDVVATAYVSIEKWLSAHHRRLLTGEGLTDYCFATDISLIKCSYTSDCRYYSRQNAKLAGKEPIETKSLRLPELKYQ